MSEKQEVQREDGSVIDGLFAAGSTGQGGLLLEGHGHHLGWALSPAGSPAATQPRRAAMIFNSQSGITDNSRAADWDAWYPTPAHYGDGAGRFIRAALQDRYAGRFAVARDLQRHVRRLFKDPYYLSVRGMGDVALIDRRYYKRNLLRDSTTRRRSPHPVRPRRRPERPEGRSAASSSLG